MKLSGHTTVWSDCPTVWAALHDVEILSQSIPGCQTLTRASKDRFDLSVEVSAGPVATVFDGTVRIVDCEPENWLLLDARGSAMLEVAGTLRILLEPSPAGCRVSYDAEFTANGVLALWGLHLLSGLAQRQVEQFATRFAAIVGSPPKPPRTIAGDVRPRRPLS